MMITDCWLHVSMMDGVISKDIHMLYDGDDITSKMHLGFVYHSKLEF